MLNNIFLIGTGLMAIDYAHVLQAQGHDFIAIGRGRISAEKFEKETGVVPIIGGIERYLSQHTFPKFVNVIIATGTEVLLPTLLLVLKNGANKVLIEKPAAVSIEELLDNEEKLRPFFGKVFVAYNRRFFASVYEAQKMILDDGGLHSMLFEFTEWSHRIGPLIKAPGVKENWFFANSTHVIDLAFYLAGKPKQWSTYSKSGNLIWHNKTNFVGAGVTQKEVLFSYISNWESAGRWSIELLTHKRRIYLKPLEEVKEQIKGSILIENHIFDDTLDKKYKPGLYKQVEQFLSNSPQILPLLEEHIENTKSWYSQMIK